MGNKSPATAKQRHFKLCHQRSSTPSSRRLHANLKTILKMPFTDKAVRAEIHDWIKKDGCKVGRITSTTPVALNMHLLEVVWKGVQKMASKPAIFYVCNTTLEAELLDRQLKDKSFHGGKIGEQSVVRKGDEPLGRVVLLSYARFRQLLNAEALALFFPCRLVVICEQEPGSNMDAVIARGQLALLARTSLVLRAGYNVKLLGLSYKEEGGQDWLGHATDVMSTPPQRLSLDLSVSYGTSQPVPEPEQSDLDEWIVPNCLARAVDVLRSGKHVVIYASPEKLEQFYELSGGANYSAFRICDSFSSDEERDPHIDAEMESALGPVRDGRGTLVLVMPGLFSTPLPFANVGMVISLASKFPQKIYDNRLHVVVSSHMGQSWRSLESQRWTGWGRDGKAAGETPQLIEAIAAGYDRYIPGNNMRIKERTHDPLRECFAMASAYPGKALNLLPMFAAVDEPRDLAVQLRIMGLLFDQDDGFILTQKGWRAEHFMGQEESLTLEAATALAGIDVERMGEKVARSILRLALIKNYSSLFAVSRPMNLQSGEDFAPFLRDFAKASRYGGPGHEHMDRGLIWLIWVTFELIVYSAGVTDGDLPEVLQPHINCPIYCETQHLLEVMGAIEAWERFLKLDTIQDAQRGDWDTPLSRAELAVVEQEIARANYPILLDIPIAVKRGGHADPEDLPLCWLRTKRPVTFKGEFDEYLHDARRSMVDGVRPEPQRQYVFFGALPMEISKNEAGNTSVTGLMWFPYDIIKSLIGDLRDENADPRLREVMLGQ